MIYALETLVKTCSVWDEKQKNQVLAWLDCAKDFGENLDKAADEIQTLQNKLNTTNQVLENYETEVKDFIKELLNYFTEQEKKISLAEYAPILHLKLRAKQFLNE